MERHRDQDLEQIRKTLLRMGGLVERQIRDAMQALVEGVAEGRRRQRPQDLLGEGAGQQVPSRLGGKAPGAQVEEGLRIDLADARAVADGSPARVATASQASSPRCR